MILSKNLNLFEKRIGGVRYRALSSTLSNKYDGQNVADGSVYSW